MSQDPDKKAEVLRLHMIEHMSARAIARQLSMSRKTVSASVGYRLRHHDHRSTRHLPFSTPSMHSSAKS